MGTNSRPRRQCIPCPGRFPATPTFTVSYAKKLNKNFFTPLLRWIANDFSTKWVHFSWTLSLARYIPTNCPKPGIEASTNTSPDSTHTFECRIPFRPRIAHGPLLSSHPTATCDLTITCDPHVASNTKCIMSCACCDVTSHSANRKWSGHRRRSAAQSQSGPGRAANTHPLHSEFASPKRDRCESKQRSVEQISGPMSHR